MRTLDRIVDVFRPNTDRCYSVSGTISFVLDHAQVVPDMEKLRKAIIDVDTLHPWYDKSPDGGTEIKKPIVGEGCIKIDNWSTPEKSCWFIIDHRSSLTKAQLLAYENYVANMAQVLAARGLPQVVTVMCSVHTHKTSSFAAKKTH